MAGGLGAVLFLGGFQAKTDKIGVVDVSQVFSDSELAIKRQDELRTMGVVRTDVMQFIRTYKVLSAEQAAKFKTLSLKPTLTAPEKAELEKVKQEVIAADKEYRALITKASPTAEETAKLQGFSDRSQAMQAMGERWAAEFQNDMRGKQEKLRGEVLDKVQGAVKEVGKKQGYTLIFVKDVAPYGANDVTVEAVKVVDKK